MKHGQTIINDRTLAMLLCVTLTALLLACQAGTTLTPSPTIDLAAVKTSAAATAYAELTALAPESTPSSTPFPTSSPIPAAIAVLLPPQCTPQPGVTIDNYPLQRFLLQQYGDMGCKLPVLSPDGKYLAYVTLARQESQAGVYFLDLVRILQVNTSQAKDREVHLAPKLDYIAALQWSPTGQLIIRESIWEGPWVIFVYNPVSNSIVSTMRLDTYGNLEWNTTHTVLYAEHSFIYGAGNCINELRGYDFEHHHRFPDFYEIYHIEKKENDPFGIPNGKINDLFIEPFGWSADGKRLWLTITFLKWQGDPAYRYELGPKQAGVLEFSATGIVFTPLATDPHFDYSFEGLPEPKIVSQVHQPRFCP